MLNPALKIDDLAAEFRIKRRIQIQNILLPKAADDLYRCLEHDVPWGLAYIDGEESRLLTADELVSFNQNDWLNLNNKVQTRAVDRFQFMYNSYMMITAYKEKRDPHLLLHSMVEFINAAPFLDLMRKVTGISSIMRADAQATRYIPGHFLKKHNDQAVKQYREVAYVLNLTKKWQADWGGLLQFMDDDGNVVDTYLPTYNSLTMFQVPAWHHVSYVAAYVPNGRYAITGWGMSRPPDA
jgi:Rps23 Pro-64 3,4-dihydroxylase Tpa1-like proline 4-hydroxylase